VKIYFRFLFFNAIFYLTDNILKYLMTKRKVGNKILTIVIGTTIVLTSIVLGTLPAYAQSHYQKGYDDGCAGNVVPGPHTSDYKRGYADGQAACSGGGGGGSNNGGGSSTSFCDDLNSGKLALAELAAHALGYGSIDTAARTLCGISSFTR
jgi:uncharacterized membrane protein YgcG